jgi:hopanoid biosynthesis associated RND transporter like protein HpnN
MNTADSQVVPEPLLTRLLCRWVELCQQHARSTLVLVLLTTLGLGYYASTNLGFNADPNALFSKDLRFQRMIAEFSQYFPVLTESLLIVVDGDTPEATREAQLALLDALSEHPERFNSVFLPGEEPFFERTGLLYGSVEDVEDFADSMALLQPLVGELSLSPTLPTLTRVIQLGLEQLESGEIDAERWQRVLNFFRKATVSVFDEYPVAISWESLLLADSGLDPTTLRVIVADPVLDRGRVLAAEAPIETVHEVIESLGLDAKPGVRVRVSGYPALNHEEMIGLAKDTGLAGTLSFVLVVIVLTAAFRSARVVVAAAVTLFVGVVWSAAFATAAVKELNPLSITYGVLVIGLGVDFIIHLGMHFASCVRDGGTIHEATRRAVRDAGPALVLCAATTTVGFLAFVPTEYRALSDLGLAASGGMVAILFQTLTLLPALLTLLLPPAALAKFREATPPRGRTFPTLRPVPVCVVAFLIVGGSLWLAPRVDLETNILTIRNPETVSVQTFEDLLENRLSTPWYLDALAPSLEEADRLAERMRELDVVDRVVTLSDFVPEDQGEKLEVLFDVAMILDMPPMAPRPALPAKEQIDALKALREFLDVDPVTQEQSPLARSARLLRDALDEFLKSVERDGDAALVELESLLLDPLPGQFDRLRESLAVGEIDIEALPETLVSRMRSADGKARIQVYPSGDLWHHEEMVAFVEAIRPIWGDITGLPVNLVESARVTWESLRAAMLWALLAITLLLFSMWRRVGDTVIALGPLLLAVLATMASTTLLPVSFNFVNVIVLPLVLGIGVDSAVHLVARARALDGPPDALLQTTTARAVLYSAITTIASFGTLAISSHGGVSSLGYLLCIGMIFTLGANLALLPALMTLRANRRTRSAPAAIGEQKIA